MENEKPVVTIGVQTRSPPEEPGAATPAERKPPGFSDDKSRQSTSKNFNLPASDAL